MSWIKLLFGASAIYDLLLGLAFLFGMDSLFARFGVTPPNHPGYVQFPALILILFAGLYFQIASNPVRFRNLIPYGVGLKIAYAGIVFFYMLTSEIPAMWKPFAYADTLFAIGFIVAYLKLGRQGRNA